MTIKTSDGQVIEVGTRIYYTGDMANRDGFGTVHNFVSDKWGQTFDIVMDDGRVWRRTFPAELEPSPGRRFVTEEYRRAKQQEAREQLRQFIARKQMVS